MSGEGDVDNMVIEVEVTDITATVVEEIQTSGTDCAEVSGDVGKTEEVTEMVIGHGGKDKEVDKARAVRALELRRERRAEQERVIVAQKSAQGPRNPQLASLLPIMQRGTLSGGDDYHFRSMIAQPNMEAPNHQFNLDVSTLARSSLWDSTPEPVCDAILIDGLSRRCTETTFVNRVIQVVSCKALNITMDEKLESRYRTCLVKQYHTDWIIDLKKVGKSQGVSTSVPLPCRLQVDAGLSRTGVVWIMPGGAEGNSSDREATVHHYNLIAATGPSDQTYDQLHLQQAAVVYVVRGFSRIPAIGDQQRKLLHRSLQQLEPDVIYLTERVATGTTSRGVMHEDLMVVLVVGCYDREEVADNLRLATDFTSTRDTIEWCSLVYERGTSVATFVTVPQVHIDVPVHYCVTGLYNIKQDIQPSQIHNAIHMDNDKLPECSIGAIMCVSDEDGSQTALVVWNERWERVGGQPCLDLRRGTIVGLAGTGRTTTVDRDVTDLPGREAYSEMAERQPRYDEKTHSLVTGVVNCQRLPSGQVVVRPAIIPDTCRQGPLGETSLAVAGQGYAQLLAEVQEDKRLRHQSDITVNRRIQQVEDSGIQATQHINSRFGAMEAATSLSVDQINLQLQQVAFTTTVLLRKALEEGNVGEAELKIEAAKWEAAGVTAPMPNMAPVNTIKYAPAKVRMTEMRRARGTSATIEEMESINTLAVTCGRPGTVGYTRQGKRHVNQANTVPSGGAHGQQGTGSRIPRGTGHGQGRVAVVVASVPAMLAAAPAPTDAGKACTGRPGTRMQSTPFPLGQPQGSVVALTETTVAGQEPWSPSDEDPVAGSPMHQEQGVHSQAGANVPFHEGRYSGAVPTHGQGKELGHEGLTMAQAVCSVFKSTLGTMVHMQTTTPGTKSGGKSSKGNKAVRLHEAKQRRSPFQTEATALDSKSASLDTETDKLQPKDGQIPSEASQAQGQEAAPSGQAAESIPGGMEAGI